MGLASRAAPTPRQPPPPLACVTAPCEKWALFLDFDGTLVELAPTPSAIRIPPDLPRLLLRLARHFDFALAILTGRSLANLDRHLPGLNISAAGQHGAERRLHNGRVEPAKSAPTLAEARIALHEFARHHPGVLVEDKGQSLAVHYRTSPQSGPALADRMETLAAASGGALETLAGKSVYELRPGGSSKGAVLGAFLADPPFAGRRPLVLGDDVTDESAFAAALALGGTAIKIGAGDTLAPWRLPAPEDVRRWLDPGPGAESG